MQCVQKDVLVREELFGLFVCYCVCYKGVWVFLFLYVFVIVYLYRMYVTDGRSNGRQIILRLTYRESRNTYNTHFRKSF